MFRCCLGCLLWWPCGWSGRNRNMKWDLSTCTLEFTSLVILHAWNITRWIVWGSIYNCLILYSSVKCKLSFCPKLNCTFHAWGIKTPKPTPISAFESPTSAASLWMKASNSLSRGRCAQRHAFFSKDLLPGMETDQSGNTWSSSVATKKRPNWKSKRWRRTFQSLIKWRDTFLKGTV